MNFFVLLVVFLIIAFLTYVIFKKLKNKICDTSIKLGVISGLTTGIIHVVFSYLLTILSGGNGFITYEETHEIINGISFNFLKIAGICLASVVPIILGRYKNVKDFFKYICFACLTYSFFYVFEWIVIFVVFYISQITQVEIIFPLNTFDSFFFALEYFPAGGFLGTVISVIISFVLNIRSRNLKN